jgi:glycosyltransferase involved in cell wall biosynthesis
VAAKLAGKTVVLQPRGNVPLTLRLHWERRLPDVLARGLAGVVWSMERLGYHVADAIITYTPSMAEELGLDRFEGKLYPNGARYVDTDEFYPRVPFEERNKVVGFLGRLDEEKNVRTLAAVAKELPEDVTFRFIGDGDLRKEPEAELAAEIEAGEVEFTGWVDHDEVPGQLSELRLLVLPSEPTEGLPTVILESLACSTPVLATPVAGVPDVVREGETGMLLNEVQPGTIAHEIRQYLYGGAGHGLSENGRRSIEADFDFEAATRRYQSIMSSVSA